MSTPNQVTPCGLGWADFLTALLDLLPRGRAWIGTNLRALLAGMADNFLRLQQRSCDLSETESFPGTAIEMLPDWEQALGLPDPCVTDALTVAQRQAACIARLAGSFNPTAANMIAYAAAIGFTITIDYPAANVWRIHAPTESIVYFLADFGVADEPLETWGNTLLECVMNAVNPAHIQLEFAYS
jgi:uncharacterized protein YmfQ (DUF2313 family)